MVTSHSAVFRKQQPEQHERRIITCQWALNWQQLPRGQLHLATAKWTMPFAGPAGRFTDKSESCQPGSTPGQLARTTCMLATSSRTMRMISRQIFAPPTLVQHLMAQPRRQCRPTRRQVARHQLSDGKDGNLPSHTAQPPPSTPPAQTFSICARPAF